MHKSNFSFTTSQPAHYIQEHAHCKFKFFWKALATNVTRWQLEGLRLGQRMQQASHGQVTPLFDTLGTTALPATALPFGIRTGVRPPSLPHHPCNLIWLLHHLQTVRNCGCIEHTFSPPNSRCHTRYDGHTRSRRGAYGCCCAADSEMPRHRTQAFAGRR
jgi:hypothetical protein